MRPDRWNLIKAVYAEAKDLEEPDRGAYLEKVRQDNESICREVQGMLSVEEADTGPLDRPPVKLGEIFHDVLNGGPLLSAGDVLCARFEIDEFLGSGGMGEVYSAMDLHLKERIAVKTIRADLAGDPRRVELLRREVRHARRITHPGVCRVYDVFTHEDEDEEKTVHFLTMQLIHGQMLDEFLREHGPPPPEEALDILDRIAQALTAAHEADVVHCDLKPANVFLVEEGEARRVIVTDFGLARPCDKTGSETASASGTMMRGWGTLAYMSPEQLGEGTPGRSSDLYSLGLIAYELVTGQAPFQSNSPLSAALKRCQGAPPPPSTLAPGLPAEWDEHITRCLAPDPRVRFANPREFIAALRGEPGRTPDHTGSLLRRLFHDRRGWISLIAAAAAMIAGIVFVMFPRATFETREYKSIAVLPFAYAGSDPERDYLSAGMTEEIINQLAHVDGLRVVSRNSAFRYRPDANLQSVARELNVHLVLTGNLELLRNRIRVHAELYDSGTNERLWSRRYDRESNQLLAVRDEIASTLVSSLRTQLGSRSGIQAAGGTRNLEAFDLYMRARYQAARRDREGLRKAVLLLEAATKKDPSYADAFSEMGNCHLLMVDYGFAAALDALPLARAGLLMSIQLDPGLANGHAVLGQLFALFDWDWQNAEKSFLHAIHLNPNHAPAHHWYGQYLSRMGRHNEALSKAQDSLRLDPVSVPTNTFLGWLHFYARHYELARLQAEKTLELNPYFVHAHVLLAESAAHLGLEATARGAAERAASLANDDVLAARYQATTFAILKDRKAAMEHLARMREIGTARQSAFTAFVFAYLGQSPATFQWLEKAYSERDPSLTLVKTHPAMDPYRNDPRYRALLARLRM